MKKEKKKEKKTRTCNGNRKRVKFLVVPVIENKTNKKILGGHQKKFELLRIRAVGISTFTLIISRDELYVFHMKALTLDW